MSLRRRSTLRLLTELYFNGVFDDATCIRAIISEYIKNEVPHDDTHNTVQLIVSFLRYAGEEFTGVVPRSKQQIYKSLSLPLLDKSAMVPQAEQTAMRAMFDKYATQCTER
jgi:hypothetical protein